MLQILLYIFAAIGVILLPVLLFLLWVALGQRSQRKASKKWKVMVSVLAILSLPTLAIAALEPAPVVALRSIDPVPIAPKPWLPSAVDREAYHWPTNRSEIVAKASGKPATNARGAATNLQRATSSGIEFPNSALRTPNSALEDEEPEAVTLAWDPGYQLGAGDPTGYILWLDTGNGAARLLTTNATMAEVPPTAGTYYVAATNRFGISAWSLGLVYPKPVTNIFILSSSITNWPALASTNQATKAWQQWFDVRYMPNGKAVVVFSSNLLTPMDSWAVFEPWPPVTNRNIKLAFRKVVQ